jgi:hypothetical protein
MTSAESELLEILRQQQDRFDDFSLLIEHKDGAWDITLSDGDRRTRGTGSTFAQAWEREQRTDWA